MSTTAIVILNWNGKHYLGKFLRELELKSDIPGVSIVIADNGSTDGSVEYLRSSHPNVRLIEFDKNYGFTGGYNKAFKELPETDYFLLLNSDIMVSEGWLEPLVKNMDSNPDVGICMPKIRSFSEPKDFEYAGACGGFIDSLGYPFCRGRILSKIETDNRQYDNAREIFWASGAALMIRSELFKALGGLDESFFAHMEEIDLCWRAKLAKWQVWVYPESVVYHVGGGTLPNNSPRKLYLNYRNNLLMLYKNLPHRTLYFILIIRMILDGLSAVVYLMQGKGKYFLSVLNAHRDFWSMMRKIERNSSSERISCVFRGSIIFSFFCSRLKLRFSNIEKDIR